jgi:hypothetical protein
VTDAERWIRARVIPVGPIETVHVRPWAIARRVPVRGGAVWFKACGAVQGFEPRLTAELAARWPGRVADVIDHDEQRGWLLLADAGRPAARLGNPPELWLAALPAYAELQRGEAAHAADHLAHGVPDLRVPRLPERYEELLAVDLPLDTAETERLRSFAPELAVLCERLVGHGVPDTVQHDDLHDSNLFVDGERLRVLDWGDASIGAPFASLVVTFRFLELGGLAPGDPWFARLRDAYLEPWGAGLAETFALALRVGTFARAIAYVRQRAVLEPAERCRFDEDFAVVLRRALARTVS